MIFRKYDIRGIYPKDLNREIAYKITLAFTNLFPQMKKIVIGMDVRKNSPEIRKGVLAGLITQKKKIIDLGITSTPLLYFSICHYQNDGGIMITGSHNLPKWNGLKLQLKNAYPIFQKDLEKIKSKVLFGNGLHPEQYPKSTKEPDCQLLNPSKNYLDYILKKISLKKPLKIIIDSGNGTTGLLPEKIFKKLGCQVKTLYPEPDGNFPNHNPPDPYLKKNLRDLKKEVLKEQADLGFAFDCDGDRIGIIDRKGREIQGNQYLIIFARDALKKKKGIVVCDIRSSEALLEDIKKNNGRPVFAPGHHKAVLDKIIEKKAVFGGETTGHLYFPLEHYLIDDPIFASCKMAEIVSQNEDFTKYLDSLPKYYANREIFIKWPDETKYQTIDKLIEYLKKKKIKFINVEGARILFDQGWAIIRAANTSPYLKIKFEGRTKQALKKIKKETISLIKEIGINL